MVLDERHLKAMVYGGAVLGAGGGGSIKAGLASGRRALAVGNPQLDELAKLPDDAMVVTLSGVGPVQKSMNRNDIDQHHSRALKLFSQMMKHPISGTIPSEVGPLAVTYGWYESARTGLPLIDAPCNGRAHPLSLMGSLSLHRFPKHLTTTNCCRGHTKYHETLRAKHESQRYPISQGCKKCCGELRRVVSHRAQSYAGFILEKTRGRRGLNVCMVYRKDAA